MPRLERLLRRLFELETKCGIGIEVDTFRYVKTYVARALSYGTTGIYPRFNGEGTWSTDNLLRMTGRGNSTSTNRHHVPS